MPESNLDIKLKLIDEASEPIKTAISGIRTETDKLKVSGENAGKSIKQEFKEAGKELRDFRQAMFLVGISVFGIIKTTKDWAQTNQETKEAYDTLSAALKGISASIGSIFAPAIVALSNLVKENIGFLDNLFNTVKTGYSNLFETITFGTQFNVAFFTSLKSGTSIAESYRIAMQTATQATKELKGEFDQTIGLGNTASIIDLGKITINKEKAKEEARLFKEEITKELSELQKSIKKIGDSIASSFGNAFAEVLVEGQSFSEAMKSIFKDMVKAILAEIARIAAVKLIAKVFGLHTGGEVEKKHSGGFIRAHNGLAIDEVPTILQTGEGVLSRRGMRNLGGTDNLNRLNNGFSSVGGGDINVNVYYPQMNNKEDVRALSDELGREIDRQRRYPRGI